MITLLTPSAHEEFLVSAFSIYRPPLILLTIISYSLVYLLGLAFMALRSTGLDPIFLLAVFVLNAIMISPPHILASVVSPKAQFSALCSLSCILPHLALLFHLFL